ncbi:MAG: hypothetical protein WAN75_37400 [Xanthobacteraceae bacterium]|jgi:hypothetical protein
MRCSTEKNTTFNALFSAPGTVLAGSWPKAMFAKIAEIASARGR